MSTPLKALIVEGSDAVGKTTVCEAIRKRTGYMYAHCGPPSHDWRLESFMTFLHPMVVYDRSFPSAYVYDRVRGYEGKQNKIPTVDHLERLFDELCPGGISTVVITLDEAVLRKRLAKNPDPLFDADSIIAANGLYQSIASLFDIHIKIERDEYPGNLDLDLIIQSLHVEL